MRRHVLAVALCCCAAMPVEAEVDPCMVGTWTAATGHLKDFYQRLQPAAPVTDVDGSVVMTVAADGQGTVTITDFVIGQDVGGSRMTNTGQGRFAFSVTTDGPRYAVEFTDLALNIKAHMHGAKPPPRLMAETDQSLKDLPSRKASGSFTCDGGSLTLADDNPGASPFPNWHR